jgi:hypothetical protein
MPVVHPQHSRTYLGYKRTAIRESSDVQSCSDRSGVEVLAFPILAAWDEVRETHGGRRWVRCTVFSSRPRAAGGDREG